jgi:hypothetical protein
MTTRFQIPLVPSAERGAALTTFAQQWLDVAAREGLNGERGQVMLLSKGAVLVLLWEGVATGRRVILERPSPDDDAVQVVFHPASMLMRSRRIATGLASAVLGICSGFAMLYAFGVPRDGGTVLVGLMMLPGILAGFPVGMLAERAGRALSVRLGAAMEDRLGTLARDVAAGMAEAPPMPARAMAN